MNWIPLVSQEQLQQLIEASHNKTHIIFKHSTRCSISSVVKSRLEKGTLHEDAPFYYLDLLTYRPVSDSIARYFEVTHESPQLLVIKNGKCVYHESHTGISTEEVKAFLN
jgi:bacillithiol system protein YtxJ